MGQLEQMQSKLDALFEELISLKEYVQESLGPPKEWLSQKEAESLLGRGYHTLYRLTRSERAVRYRKVGKASEYYRVDIEAYKADNSYKYFLPKKSAAP